MFQPTPAEILATFAHEVRMGAYRPEELPDAAKRALERAGMLELQVDPIQRRRREELRFVYLPDGLPF